MREMVIHFAINKKLVNELLPTSSYMGPWPKPKHAPIKVAEHSFLVPMRYRLLSPNHWQLGSQNWQDASSTKKDYILFTGLGTVIMATQLVVNQH